MAKADTGLVVPELGSIEVQGITRSSFIMRGAIAAGAVYGAGAVSPFVRQAFAQTGGSGGGDIEIANFALTLEYLEAAFYQQAQKKVSGLKGNAKKYAKEFGDNEMEHVTALKGLITDAGGTPVKAPGVDFGDAFSSQDKFLKTAQTFEDLGVGAYNGAGPMIESKDVLASAGAIVQVEGRHASLIRLEIGEPPAPDAFDKALEKQAVLDKVQPFLA